jgi:hypothetical protein
VHLFKTRRYPEMQRYVEQALFLDPSNWQALWYQVKLSETFGDYARVISTLKEIQRFYPASKVAQEKLKMLQPPAPGTGVTGPAVPGVPGTPGIPTSGTAPGQASQGLPGNWSQPAGGQRPSPNLLNSSGSSGANQSFPNPRPGGYPSVSAPGPNSNPSGLPFRH